jgi:hypothetical protein
MLNRPIAMALGISIVLAATLAGLAQAQPIADLQPIVGTWEGTLKLSTVEHSQ